MLYKESIEELKKETGLNIVAWSANNRGNGDRNLHIAILKPEAKREASFAKQANAGNILHHAYSAHWHGQCDKGRIKKALGI